MNMLVTAKLSMKGSKRSVLTVEQTSSKRKSFGKKKKSVKKQKVDGKNKKTGPKKKASEKGKCFHVSQKAIGSETILSIGHPKEQEEWSFWRYAHYRI